MIIITYHIKFYLMKIKIYFFNKLKHLKLVTLENGQYGHLFTLLDVFKGIDHYLNNAELTELELHCYTRGKNKLNMVDLYNLQEDFLNEHYCSHEENTNTSDI